MKPIVLSRTGRAPLRFKGELLAETTTGGVSVSIFHTEPDRLYRTRYVVAYHREGRPRDASVYRFAGDVAQGVLDVLGARDLALDLLARADLPDPWSTDVLDLVVVEPARGVRYA